MSESVHIVFVVKNIEEIHKGPDKAKRNEAIAAAKGFIKTLDLEHEDIIIDFLRQEGDLTLYSPGLITIPDLESWIKTNLGKWKKMAFQVLGPDCKPFLELEYPDGEIVPYY